MKSKHIGQYRAYGGCRRLAFSALLSAALSCLYSCQTEVPSQDEAGSVSPVVPEVRIEDIAESRVTDGTRAVIAGSSFSSGATYGLMICRHWDSSSGTANSYEPFIKSSRNIKATYSSSRWSYTYDGSTYTQLFLNSREDGIGADAFAYAPYRSGITSPESIPILLENREDIMWAVENADVSHSNRNIIPDGSGKTVKFHFRHVLSLLKIGIRLNSIPSTPSSDNLFPSSLRYITITTRTDESATPLYSSATLNALTGTVSDAQRYAPGGTYVHYIKNDDKGDGGNTILSLGTSESTINILLIPTDYANDGDYVLSFYIDGVSMPLTYSIRRSDLMHSDGETCGFQPGYVYTLHFVYDNYIRLEGVSVRSEWKENDPTEIII